jgi:hypothetical protein
MIGNTTQHRSQISFRIDAIQLRRAQQTVDHRRPLPASIGPCKQIILAADGDGTQRAFCSVVIDFEVTIVALAHQRRPARERVADRSRNFGFARDPREGGFKPFVQRY